MTTIIGIAGKDPETLENYVLICADSRGTIDGRLVSDSEKKIFGKLNNDSDGNYVLGVAGKCVESLFSGETFENLDDFLKSPKIETKESIEDKLKSMDAIIYDISGSKNRYLVSLNEEIPKIYFFNGVNLVESGSYCAIGSGMEHTSYLDVLKEYKIDGRVMLPRKVALDVAEKAMHDAAMQDTATGGMMNVAIISKGETKFIPNYAELNKSRILDENANEDISNVQVLGEHPYFREDE